MCPPGISEVTFDSIFSLNFDTKYLDEYPIGPPIIIFLGLIMSHISPSPFERGIGHLGGASSAAELVTSLYRKTAVKLPPFKVEDVRLKNEYLNCYKSL